MPSRRYAFTLIEIAILLVIVGLLAGAVLAGQSMWRAQQVRSALQDAKTYATALGQFKDKYGALPGDMPDAERIWGNAEGGAITTNCALPNGAISDGTTTCNGNGDGIITVTEGYWAWQQLRAAGMTAGSYKGAGWAGGGGGWYGGITVPQGALGQSVYGLNSYGVITAATNYFPGDYNNVLIFFKPGLVFGLPALITPILTPGEAYGIDKKVDDGLPGTGDIRTPSNAPLCATTSDPTTSVYTLSGDSSTAQCLLYFLKTFQAKPAQ